jgi:hypothetical protein
MPTPIRTWAWAKEHAATKAVRMLAISKLFRIANPPLFGNSQPPGSLQRTSPTEFDDPEPIVSANFA